MSMLFDLRRIAKEEADALAHDPSDIFFFLHGNEPYEPPKGFFHKLFGPKSEPKMKREWKVPPEDMVISLDKNWHVIHYLISRAPWEGPLPQATLMSGGEELGSIDVGYGPARLLRKNEIEEFTKFLGSLDKENYASGISASELEENEIYGAYPEWSSNDSESLWESIEELKSFFSKAKENNENIIVYLY